MENLKIGAGRSGLSIIQILTLVFPFPYLPTKYCASSKTSYAKITEKI
jgi:hypothetical protein